MKFIADFQKFTVADEKVCVRDIRGIGQSQASGYVLLVVMYYLWLCITCGYVLLVVMYYLWLCITCGYVLLVVMYYLWLCITCGYVLLAYQLVWFLFCLT